MMWPAGRIGKVDGAAPSATRDSELGIRLVHVH